MKERPRIIFESLTITGPDGKKFVRAMKEGDSFPEAYWSLALEAYGLKAVRKRAGRKRAKGMGLSKPDETPDSC
jgi:hypothetical protein